MARKKPYKFTPAMERSLRVAASEASKEAAQASVAALAKKRAEESLLKKTQRKLKEVFYGSKTYSKKKVVPSGKKPKDTVRTKGIKRQLKSALTQKEIARFQDKK